MKYLSVDIETTGLDPSWCQTLEVGAVLADTLDFTTPVEDLPSWRCRFYYDRIVGNPVALHMNAQLILDMDTRPAQYNYMHPDSFWSQFTHWLESELGPSHPKISCSGKNFGMFDARFLERLPRWQREYFKIRVLDPGQFFFRQDDEILPDLKTCIARSGIAWDEATHHDAVEDARMVVMLNRVGLKRKWEAESGRLFRPMSAFKFDGSDQVLVFAFETQEFKVVRVWRDGQMQEGLGGPIYFKEDCPYSHWSPLDVNSVYGR